MCQMTCCVSFESETILQEKLSVLFQDWDFLNLFHIDNLTREDRAVEESAITVYHFELARGILCMHAHTDRKLFQIPWNRCPEKDGYSNFRL